MFDPIPVTLTCPGTEGHIHQREKKKKSKYRQHSDAQRIRIVQTLKLHVGRRIHPQLPLELSSRKFIFWGADY